MHIFHVISCITKPDLPTRHRNANTRIKNIKVVSSNQTSSNLVLRGLGLGLLLLSKRSHAGAETEHLLTSLASLSLRLALALSLRVHVLSCEWRACAERSRVGQHALSEWIWPGHLG